MYFDLSVCFLEAVESAGGSRPSRKALQLFMAATSWRLVNQSFLLVGNRWQMDSLPGSMSLLLLVSWPDESRG